MTNTASKFLSIPKQTDSADLLSLHFTLAEANSKDGQTIPEHLKDNAVMLATNLEFLRSSLLSRPIKIHSWYRSVEHNKAVGGSPNSQHLLAKAADISVSDLDPVQIKSMIELLIKMGLMSQGGIGLYDTFVHYDIRGTEARWDLRKAGSRPVVTL